MGSVSTDCIATQLPAFCFEKHCQRPLQISIYLLEAPGQTEAQGPVRHSGANAAACGQLAQLPVCTRYQPLLGAEEFMP